MDENQWKTWKKVGIQMGPGSRHHLSFDEKDLGLLTGPSSICMPNYLWPHISIPQCGFRPSYFGPSTVITKFHITRIPCDINMNTERREVVEASDIKYWPRISKARRQLLPPQNLPFPSATFKVPFDALQKCVYPFEFAFTT